MTSTKDKDQYYQTITKSSSLIAIRVDALI
jgi:hypothetical protein